MSGSTGYGFEVGPVRVDAYANRSTDEHAVAECNYTYSMKYVLVTYKYLLHVSVQRCML